MTDRQTSQQAKSEGVQRTMKDINPTASPIKLYLVGEERRSAETQDEIKEKAAFEDLEQSFKTLTSRKIKDKLSAFLPDIPGDLDATSMGHNTLKAVIDRPPIEDREFAPLSELQGFKLLPGALPDKYRRIFPKEPIRHEHKKKHKHKKLEVRKHEAAAAAEPPSSVPEGTGDITAGTMIQAAGLGQVITTGTAALIGVGASVKQQTVVGAVDPKKKKIRKRKHEGGGEGDAQNGHKKAKKKSKKKDKDKEKHLSGDQPSVQITSTLVTGHPPL